MAEKHEPATPKPDVPPRTTGNTPQEPTEADHIGFAPPANPSAITPPATLVGTVPSFALPPSATPTPKTLVGGLSPATAEWLAARPSADDPAPPAATPFALTSEAIELPAEETPAAIVEEPATNEPVAEAESALSLNESTESTMADTTEPAAELNPDDEIAVAPISIAPVDAPALDSADAPTIASPTPVTLPVDAEIPESLAAETIAVELAPVEVAATPDEAIALSEPVEEAAAETPAEPVAEQPSPAIPPAIPVAAVAVAAVATAAAHSASAAPSDAAIYAHAHDDVEHRGGLFASGPITKLAGFAGLLAIIAGLGVMLLACAGQTPFQRDTLLLLNRPLVYTAIVIGVIGAVQLAWAILSGRSLTGSIVTLVVAGLTGGLVSAIYFGCDSVNGVNPLMISRYIAMTGAGGMVLTVLGGFIEHRRMREETHVLGSLFVNLAAALGGLLLWALESGVALL